jgi:ABC-type polysaccharide/polyol phosphate transport system ATPase subunit
MSATMTVIEFRSVSKYFRRHPAQILLRNRIAQWWNGLHRERFCALKNISFQVSRGESLAVVGRNGAGKSTLLSLVAGLAKPDEGSVQVNGRVAPLLELGSGFHPDLTGKENVFLNASLLGLTRKRTYALYDSIVEFSGIGEFINEPLRTYSTGMVLRLAFSVAINMDPEILIVDEVLSVGDSNFQTKCYERVTDLRNAGKTILAVSHASQMIQQLCKRAIWLDAGELVMSGTVRDVMEAYAGSRASVGGA